MASLSLQSPSFSVKPSPSSSMLGFVISAPVKSATIQKSPTLTIVLSPAELKEPLIMPSDVQSSGAIPPPTATGKPLACKLKTGMGSVAPSPITYRYITSPKQQFSGSDGKTSVVLFALTKTKELGVN